MSLFKNRIPKNSVFSEETYELQFPKPASVQIEEEELQADHAELRAQQESLHMEMNQLRQEKQMLERERQQLLQDKEQFQMHIHEQMEQMEAARVQFQKNNKKQHMNGQSYYGINLFI